jgi:hypothetical protein
VAPGAGVSFRAWRQIGELISAPVKFIPIEYRPWSLARKWKRFLHRYKSSRSAMLLPQADGKPAFVCVSHRLAHLLPDNHEIKWKHIPVEHLGSPDKSELLHLELSYSRWWRGCEMKLQSQINGNLADPKFILFDIGRMQSKVIYPKMAWTYIRACERLNGECPRLLLCDTQEGSIELAWALAARSLGVPVAAFTYDHNVEPRFSFKPDWLLCDSGYQTHVAVHRGIQESKIIHVYSHRRPEIIQINPTQRLRKKILYADSYYSGTTAKFQPYVSSLHYQMIVEAASFLPDIDFYIKFHPLRDRKKSDECFVGIDENELYYRTRFIHSLQPPPNLKLLNPEEKLLNYLPEMDILLNANSSAGLEAFALGVPVIFLHPPAGVNDFPHIYEYEACALALNANVLKQQILDFLQNSKLRKQQIFNQHRYLDEFHWRQDSIPIMDAIQSILCILERASQTASTGTSEAEQN